MADRERFVYMAKLAEQAERYEEMVANMKEVAKQKSEMSVEERNLLSVGFKNVIGWRRSSWRIISSLEAKEESKGGDSDRLKIVREYRGEIEKELQGTCDDILDLLDNYLIPCNSSPEAKVFFLKMKGDYCRYLAEFVTEQKRLDTADRSLKAYSEATKIAEELPATHPIRLGLALNFSVFYYEILSDRDRAVKMAKNAFDTGISDLGRLPEDSYKDSTLIMQLLRDNLTLWTSEEDEKTNGDNSVQDPEQDPEEQ